MRGETSAWGQAEQIYNSITTGPGWFRLGLVAAFVSAFLFLMAAWGLYVVLRTVNKELALLFLILNAVGVAIQCASLLHLVYAMLIGGLPSALPGVAAAEAQALALLAINVYRTGFVAAQLFLGTWLFPLGYLVYKSGLLPRILGVLLILDGVAEMIWFLQAFLLPAYPQIKVPGTAVSLVAEIGLALWLLVKGVKATGSGIDVPPATPAATPAATDHRTDSDGPPPYDLDHSVQARPGWSSGILGDEPSIPLPPIAAGWREATVRGSSCPDLRSRSGDAGGKVVELHPVLSA